MIVSNHVSEEQQVSNKGSNKIGNKIRERRRKFHITQAELAEICDISTVYMSRIENGSANPSLDILLNLAAALDTTPDFFLTDTAHASVYYLNDEISQKLQKCSPRTLRILNKMIDVLLAEQKNDKKE